MRFLISIVLSVLVLLPISSVHAACKDGTRTSFAGLSLQLNGCYTDGSGHEYSMGSSSSSAPAASELVTGENILWLEDTDIRNGNVDMNTIPNVIVSIITFLLAIAGSVSVAALIYHAVKMQLASGLTGDSSWVDKAKAGMKWAIIGFIISVMAWFLVTRAVEILSSI